MINVANNPFMLSTVILSVVILSAAVPIRNHIIEVFTIPIT